MTDPMSPAARPVQRPDNAIYACALCFVAFVLAYLDRQIISVMVETMRQDLALSDTGISLLHGFAFSVLFAVAGYPLGKLSDVSNRRNILVAGIVVWSVATMLCGLASDFWHLFASRVAVGIGEACLAPACASLLADYFEPGRRGRAMSMMSAGASTGGGLSILLGGLVLQLAPAETHIPLIGTVAPWQLAFLLVGTPGLLLAALMLSVAEPARQEALHADGAQPHIGPHFRAHPAAFAYTYAAFACAFIILYAYSSWMPALLIRAHGMEPGQIAFIVGIALIVNGPVAGIVGGAASDAAFRRRGPIGRYRLLLWTIAGLLLFGLLLARSGHLWTTLLALQGLSFFGSMLAGLSYQIINEMVPNRARGRAVAIYLMVGNILGLGLSPTAVALLTDHVFNAAPGDVRYSIVTVVIPAALLGILFILLGSKPYRVACDA